MGGELPTTLAPQTGLDLFRAEFDSAPDSRLFAITPQVDVTDDQPYRREFMLSKIELKAIVYPVPSRLAVVTATKLNVRTGAGTTFPTVAQLTAGNQVKVIDADVTGWLKITEGDYAGRFISSAYVSFPIAPA